VKPALFVARRHLAALVLVAAVLGPAPAFAVRANPDLAFVARESAAIDSLAAALLPKAGSPAGAVAAVEQVLDARNAALRRLNEKLPLTTFDGIETGDRYDTGVVLALKQIVDMGRAAEGEAPPQEDAIYFSVILGEIPPLGKSPVGFMVLQHAHMAVNAVNALDNDPAISGDSARKLALRFMEQGMSLYAVSHVDAYALHEADSFRQSSVVVRLRCPTDGSTYRITDQKNKLGPNGEMSTLYYLKSNTTYEELVLEFPLPYVTRLNQAGERQELKEKPLPTKASSDVEP